MWECVKRGQRYTSIATRIGIRCRYTKDETYNVILTTFDDTGSDPLHRTPYFFTPAITLPTSSIFTDRSLETPSSPMVTP